jgi:hypothetical protein
MRKTLWGALLTVVILLGVAPAAHAAVTTCADGVTNCDPYNTDQTDTGPATWGTSGQSVVCRATYGTPSTYCFLETWVWSETKKAWVPGPCSRGFTSAGWCTCEVKTGRLGGSCSFR